MNHHFTEESEAALVRCAVWLFVGFVGASLVASGILGMFSSDRRLEALAIALCGSVMAGVGWHRARKIIETEALGVGSEESFTSDDGIAPPAYRRCFEPTATTDLRGGL